MPKLPWEERQIMPWEVNSYFPGSDNALYRLFQNPESPTGYSIERRDANGAVTYQTGPSPGNPSAYSEWLEGTPQGRAASAYMGGLAENNEFNRNLQLDQLKLSKRKLDQDYSLARMQAKNQQEANEIDRWYKGELVKNAQAQLGLSTLQLGASLRGPRDWLAYTRAASGASADPALRGAIDQWASMTSGQASGMGGWGAGTPERMTLGALAGDFSGNTMTTPGSVSSVYNTTGATGTSAPQTGLMGELNYVGMNPLKAAPGWFESKNPDQQQMILGAWEEQGHSPATVMSRYFSTRPNQQISSNNAA